MTALKREVAAHKARQVFRGANVRLGNWRQVTIPIKEIAMLDGRISVESRWDTHGNVYGRRLSYLVWKCKKEATFFMASRVMRTTLKTCDHQLVDQSARGIIETVKKTGSQVGGPVLLPIKREVVTILRAVHKHKDSREQFERRTHRRLIGITTPSQRAVDALSRLEMPAGVYIDIKMKTKQNGPRAIRFQEKMFIS